MMKDVTGSHFKPIFPAYVLNEDCSSQYYFAGTTINDTKTNSWARVKTASLENRNKDSMWSNNDTTEGVCKGIRIKYACGGSAAGFIYPICIIVSGLSKEELPKDDFTVVPIEGLSINGHIDPRNKEVGYMCLIGSNVSQKHFFQWYNEHITYPTIKCIRKKYNPMSQGYAEEGQVPIDQEVCMWGDSDIPYLQQMTSPERIQLSIARGIYFAKIGAKITETSQPLDLGPFFKILKQSGRNMTSVGIVTPLSILIDIIFTSLRKKKQLVLSKLKENALKDCLNTTPEMIAKSFSKQSLIQSFVSAGMIDEKTKTCPDMYAIIDSFKINWSQVAGGKRWFIGILPKVMSEMFTYGEVSEDFFNTNDFPLDSDHDGNIWHLKSTADHLTRSKVLYHPTVIAKKQEVILQCMAAKNTKAMKAMDEANDVLELNKDCENALINMVKGTKDCKDMSTIDILSDTSMIMFAGQRAPLLSSFYKCRFQTDLKKKIVLPSKGNMEKIDNKEKDKKTDGPFLIQLAFNSRSLPIIGEVPTLAPIEIPTMFYKPPTVILFESKSKNAIIESINLEWIDKMSQQISSLSELNRDEERDEYRTNIPHLDKYSDMCSTKILNRLSSFLRTRIPLNRIDLLPGRHWVWDSLRSKLKKISCIMIMSGHIVDEKDLQYRSDDESLLTPRHQFISVESMLNDLDGNYITYDSKRSLFFRSGTAEMGMKRRWKEHVSASMRTQSVNRSSKLYSSYPHSNCEKDNMPSVDEQLGNFQQIEQLIGIGIERKNLTTINQLFDWSDEELVGLQHLKGVATRDTIGDKKYKHLCYLFEAAYALALEPRRNISGNPGCEWQLNYFG